MGVVQSQLGKRLETACKDPQFKLYIASAHSDAVHDILESSCNKPKLTKMLYLNLLDKVHISDQEVINVTDHVYKNAYVGTQKVGKDQLLNIFMYMTSSFLKVHQENYAKIALSLVGFATYAKLLGKYFRYCDKDMLNYTLDLMHTKSYVKKYGTFAGIIDKITTDELLKHREALLEYNDDVYPLILQSIRNKLNQIMGLIARMYYDMKKHGFKVKGESVDQEGQPKHQTVHFDFGHVADSVLQHISNKRNVDDTTVEKISSLYRIDKTVITKMLTEMTNIKHHQELHTIIVLLLNSANLNDEKELCGEKLPTGAKMLVASRKPSGNYKVLVYGFLQTVLKEGFNRDLNSLSIEFKSKLLNSFNFALMHFIRERYCQ